MIHLKVITIEPHTVHCMIEPHISIPIAHRAFLHRFLMRILTKQVTLVWGVTSKMGILALIFSLLPSLLLPLLLLLPRPSWKR